MSVKLQVKTLRREKTLEIDDSQRDLIHALDTPEVKFPFGCKSASCGVCRARIHSGGDLLEEVGLTEEDTLDRCKVAGTHRLMCRARIKSGANGLISVESEEEE